MPTAGASRLEQLPTELLQEIVKIYLRFDVDNSIVTVTQICYRIRQAALGMTEIWRGITLLPANRPMSSKYRYRDVEYLY
jgi:hypothetical protein